MPGVESLSHSAFALTDLGMRSPAPTAPEEPPAGSRSGGPVVCNQWLEQREARGEGQRDAKSLAEVPHSADGFAGRRPRAAPSGGPVHLWLESTGLQLFSCVECRKARARHTKLSAVRIGLPVATVLVLSDAMMMPSLILTER